MKHQHSRDIIIKWTSLPEYIQDICKDMCGFHNDCLIDFRTEFDISNDNWTMESIEDYYIDQRTTNSKWCKADTLEDFITDYGLEMEVYLFKEFEGLDLDSVDRVLIDICW